MPKYYVTYNNYFGYCVVEEINGTGRIVFSGSIEKCNQKCIELNAEAWREISANDQRAPGWVQYKP